MRKPQEHTKKLKNTKSLKNTQTLSWVCVFFSFFVCFSVVLVKNWFGMTSNDESSASGIGADAVGIAAFLGAPRTRVTAVLKHECVACLVTSARA